ncbi:hypothetical protein LJC29_07565, partial [Bacteroides sp. OttesenSCG-928-N06]|nr:hypothetical protein [Bacteroides sp. OttesenSCG-928-N06]
MKRTIQTTGWLKQLWAARKYLLKCSLAGILISIIAIFSIPNEYETTILCGTELTRYEIAAEESPLSALGLEPEKALMRDGVRPSLYPQVVSSVSFLVSLFDIPVATIPLATEADTLTLFSYMNGYQRYSWWNLPKLLENKETTNNDTIIDIFHLSESQGIVVDDLKKRISVETDIRRRTTKITVRMQDPLVAALVADSVSARIQTYIRKYRIQKELNNITYLEEVHNQAQEAYHQAQKIHAHFVDRNHDLATQSARKELTNLRIEKDIAYFHYVKTRRQLQAAKSRAVIERPVYSVIEPATVPITSASPRPVLLILVFTLLFVTMGCVWILWGKSKYILLRNSLGEK